MSRPGAPVRAISHSMQQKTVVLVTGANQGLGYEIVKSLSAQFGTSYQILLGSRDVRKGEEAAASLGAPANVNPIQLDVTDDGSIERAVGAVGQWFGKLDVLVNNAGIAGRAFTADTSPREKYRQIYEVNVVSVAALTDAFAPLLNKSARPSVIMMSSELGSVEWCLTSPGWVDVPPYSVSKSALNGLAAQYVRRFPDWKVNCCNPGYCGTELNGGQEDPRARKASQGAERAVQLCVEMGREGGPSGTNSTTEEVTPW